MSFTLDNLLTISMLVPKVVLGIEGLITEAKSGATKKQMALDALAVATATATDALPQYAPLTGAAAEAAGASIDMWVAVFNRMGKFKTSPAAAPQVAVAPTSVVSTPGN